MRLLNFMSVQTRCCKFIIKSVLIINIKKVLRVKGLRTHNKIKTRMAKKNKFINTDFYLAWLLK
ncbi:MAG: hypothetical protein JWQ27_2984 [Ferruginibacter sp.]|nr:hypothetical protein [Ferruginibacter sp.]